MVPTQQVAAKGRCGEVFVIQAPGLAQGTASGFRFFKAIAHRDAQPSRQARKQPIWALHSPDRAPGEGSPALRSSPPPRVAASVERRWLLGAALLGGLFGAVKPGKAHPWSDLPVDQLQPLTEQQLQEATQRLSAIKGYLLPSEQRLLERYYQVQAQANRLVQAMAEARAQGNSPYRLLDREAHRAQQGDPVARAVLEFLRQYWPVDL